jgi:hypothetical protein
MFDLIVYNGRYATMNALVEDVTEKIGNQGDVDYYTYRGRQAAVMELNFGQNNGWAVCLELPTPGNQLTILIALAYGPENRRDLELFHISALDSISPTSADRFYPGPLIEYSYPRGAQKQVNLAVAGVSAMIRENDAEAAQVLIEREFRILQMYANTERWQEAWTRYYRFIYRDSWDRVSSAASVLARSLGGHTALTDEAKREFAQRALNHVQRFRYERDLSGSDFVNMVCAITEGRGSCDSHSMLWAIILAHADIRAAMMVSRNYSHAMGLADIAGTGARFDVLGTQWLVAETTANVEIGLIAQDTADPQHWLGILFD